MPKRKLSEKEINILKSVYLDTVDYSKIRLTNKNVFSYILKKFSGITFGNKIIFTKKSYRKEFSDSVEDMALLMHEVCHVWQYQNLKYWWFRAMLEHLKYGKSVYQFDIEEHEIFIDFRFEQQGEIMAYYYRYLADGNEQLIEKYRNVIRQSIK